MCIRDSGSTLEYYNGSAWVTYTAGSFVAIPSGSTTLQVRTSITRDSLSENPETFLLLATNAGGSSDSGLGTITDNQNPVANPDTATAREQGTADTTVLNGANGGSSGGNAVGNVITGVVTGTTAGSSTADNPTDGGTPVVSSVINPAKTSTATTVAAGTTSASSPASAAGQYGTLLIGADGSYIYQVDNANTAVQALRLSTNTLTDTFSYTISDGYGGTSTSTLTITINGANDAPVASPDYNVAKESITAGLVGGASAYDPMNADNTTGDRLGYKATGNVLPNDTDVDAGDGKSIVGLTGSATASTVSNTVLNFSSAPSNIKAGYYVFKTSGSAINQLLDANGNPIRVSPSYSSGSSITLTGTVAQINATTPAAYSLAGTETLFFSCLLYTSDAADESRPV
jgi:VCBS repeat-containing protein